MTDRRLEAAAKALAEANIRIHGPKGATWEKIPGYERDGYRNEAAKILAVHDAVTPPDQRWTPETVHTLEGGHGG